MEKKKTAVLLVSINQKNNPDKIVNRDHLQVDAIR